MSEQAERLEQAKNELILKLTPQFGDRAVGIVASIHQYIMAYLSWKKIG